MERLAFFFIIIIIIFFFFFFGVVIQPSFASCSSIDNEQDLSLPSYRIFQVRVHTNTTGTPCLPFTTREAET
jgi:hypothetical protein